MQQVAASRFGWLKYFFSFSNLFLKFRGVISITAVIILLTSFQGIIESVEEGTPLPFFKKVGGQVLNHDNDLYVESQKIIDQGGIPVQTSSPGGFTAKVKFWWGFIKSLGGVFVNLWFFYFFIFIMYKVAMLITNNSSAITMNFLLALIFVAMLQIVANFVVIDESSDETENQLSLAQKVYPFRGFVNFASAVPLLTTPAYHQLSEMDLGNMELPESSVVVDGGNLTTINNTS